MAESEFPYRRIAESGVEVVSTKPFHEPEFFDNRNIVFYLFWSWGSWGTMILEQAGWERPRRLFKTYVEGSRK